MFLSEKEKYERMRRFFSLAKDAFCFKEACLWDLPADLGKIEEFRFSVFINRLS